VTSATLAPRRDAAQAASRAGVAAADYDDVKVVRHGSQD